MESKGIIMTVGIASQMESPTIAARDIHRQAVAINAVGGDFETGADFRDQLLVVETSDCV